MKARRRVLVLVSDLDEGEWPSALVTLLANFLGKAEKGSVEGDMAGPGLIGVGQSLTSG